MSLLKHLLLTQGAGAGKPEVVFPMEYVFTEGTGAYNMKYDDLEGRGPYNVASTIYVYPTDMGNRKIVRMRDGTLYAAYYTRPDGYYQVFVSKSVDNGVNWIDETNIGTYAGMDTNSQTRPSIAIDGNDNLHVVWFGKATGYTNTQAWYSKYDGSWSIPTRLSTYAGMSGYPQDYVVIAVDSNDNIHVLWQGAATGYTAYQVWYRKYTTEWSSPTRISTLTSMESYAQGWADIAIDSNDHVHAVWQGETEDYHIGERHQIWHALYDGSWQTPERISTAGGMEVNAQKFSSIAIGSDNHLHVSWHGKATGDTNSQIWYALYDGSWQTPVSISTYTQMNIYLQQYPSVMVDIDNYVYVLWHGKALEYSDQDKVWFAKYTDSWSAPVCLQPTGKNTNPKLRWSRWP